MTKYNGSHWHVPKNKFSNKIGEIKRLILSDQIAELKQFLQIMDSNDNAIFTIAFLALDFGYITLKKLPMINFAISYLIHTHHLNQKVEILESRYINQYSPIKIAIHYNLTIFNTKECGLYDMYQCYDNLNHDTRLYCNDMLQYAVRCNTNISILRYLIYDVQAKMNQSFIYKGQHFDHFLFWAIEYKPEFAKDLICSDTNHLFPSIMQYKPEFAIDLINSGDIKLSYCKYCAITFLINCIKQSIVLNDTTIHAINIDKSGHIDNYDDSKNHKLTNIKPNTQEHKCSKTESQALEEQKALNNSLYQAISSNQSSFDLIKLIDTGVSIHSLPHKLHVLFLAITNNKFNLAIYLVNENIVRLIDCKICTLTFIENYLKNINCLLQDEASSFEDYNTLNVENIEQYIDTILGANHPDIFSFDYVDW